MVLNQPDIWKLLSGAIKIGKKEQYAEKQRYRESKFLCAHLGLISSLKRPAEEARIKKEERLKRPHGLLTCDYPQANYG